MDVPTGAWGLNKEIRIRILLFKRKNCSDSIRGRSNRFRETVCDFWPMIP